MNNNEIIMMRLMKNNKLEKYGSKWSWPNLRYIQLFSGETEENHEEPQSG
jgi:hypothetical protein